MVNRFEKPETARPFESDWLWAVLLALAVFLAYQPVYRAGFIWDDDAHVTANPVIIGPLGLREIWSTGAGQFFPLTLTTFWVEHALWGLRPLSYHLVNVAQHALCSVVLGLVLRSLRVPGAWLGAALWALHPLQVESVAWISELKNTQSCLFYLLAILFYLRWLGAAEKSKALPWSYNLALICAALAMMSKSSTLVCPVVLALAAWWMDGRWNWRRLVPLLPFFLLSTVALAFTVALQFSGTAPDSEPMVALSWPQRIAASGDVIWFYLGKLLWPYPLMAIYPRWQIDAGQISSYLPLLAVIALKLVLWSQRRAGSLPAFLAFASFLVALLPFLGFLNQSFWRYSLVEDHLQNLAGIGPLALIGAGLARGAEFVLPGRAGVPALLGGGLALLLGLLSWQRAGVYESEETLWADTLAKNPACWLGENNLGIVRLRRGDVPGAIMHYQRALQIKPDFALASYNLATAYFHVGKVDEAISQYRQTLAINPTYALASDNLGNALVKKGRLDEAMAAYRQAYTLDHGYAKAHYNLAVALARAGREVEAQTEYETAVKINPRFPEAWNALGEVLLKKGQLDSALTQFQKAVAAKPDFAPARANLGAIYLQKGQFAQAIDEYQKTLALDPSFVLANYNLGTALNATGRTDDARLQFQKAVALNPNDAEARNNFGIALAQTGHLDEALTQFQKAVNLAPANAEAHGNLGNLLLQKGQIDNAIAQFDQALALTPNDPDLHDIFGLALAQKGQFSAAAVQFQKVLSLKPGDPQAQANLAKAQTMARGAQR